MNAYIVFDLEYWPSNPLNTVTLIQQKNTDKNNYVYSDYGIAFDGVGSLSFGNHIARKCCNFWC